MNRLMMSGISLYFMNENDAYQLPAHDDAQPFAVWHDEEGQYWLDIFYDREWHRAFLEPLASMEEVITSAVNYGYGKPPKKR
ncbi:TPA: hypothetical protein ACSTLS_000672 [Serratia fonticola]